MKRLQTWLILVFGAIALNAPGGSAAIAADAPLAVTVARAPVSPDGVTAGAIPDFVLTFVDRDQGVPGIDLQAGATVAVTLPSEFTDAGNGGTNLGIILQGWPQSPPAPPPAFPWTTSVVGNVVTVTLTADFVGGGGGGYFPGPKQLHLVLGGMVNPGAGMYDLDLVITPDPTSVDTLSGTGTVEIIPATTPTVSAVAIFSGPPGGPPPFFNPLAQTVPAGDSGRQVGVVMWDAAAAPMIGVTLQMTGATAGELVLDGAVVGNVTIEVPAGATAQTLSAAGPSTEVGPLPATALLAGGLVTTFSPDPTVTGRYAVTFSMTGGNAERLEFNHVTPFQTAVSPSGVSLSISNGGSVSRAAASVGAVSIFVTSDGALVGYVAGAPDFVNESFMRVAPGGQLMPGTPVLIVAS